MTETKTEDGKENYKVDKERDNVYLRELLDKLIVNNKLSAYDVIEILSKIEANLDKVVVDKDDKEELLMKLQEMVEKVKELKVSE